jgi:hypothetical protein
MKHPQRAVALPRVWRSKHESNAPINETPKAARTPFEETVCAMAGRVLMRDFPGFHWAIRVNEATGMWHLLNQDLSGEWGYTGKTGDIFSASDFEKEIRMAAGGILEYFGVRRGCREPGRARAAAPGLRRPRARPRQERSRLQQARFVQDEERHAAGAEPRGARHHHREIGPDDRRHRPRREHHGRRHLDRARARCARGLQALLRRRRALADRRRPAPVLRPAPAGLEVLLRRLQGQEQALRAEDARGGPQQRGDRGRGALHHR